MEEKQQGGDGAATVRRSSRASRSNQFLDKETWELHLAHDDECNASVLQNPFDDEGVAGGLSSDGVADVGDDDGESLVHVFEPTNYHEAVGHPQWDRAMQEELSALKSTNTYSVVELPHGRVAVGSKWIYKVKRDAERRVVRCKARLCAQGFNQKAGVDFTETFAPTMKLASLRVLIALAARHRLHLYQFDIKSAFLNADLHEEVYLRLPPGFPRQSEWEGKRMALLLHKCIYGLKQSPHEWNNDLNGTLMGMGFSRLAMDACVYRQVHDQHDHFDLVGLHVDDLILATSDGEDGRHRFGDGLRLQYDVTDIGPVKFLINIRVHRSLDGGVISLDQQQSVVGLLEQYNMSHCNPVSTPMVANLKLGAGTSSKEEMKDKPYAALVGSLLYLSQCTRPDIAFAVGVLCRFMQQPGVEHWTAAKHVLRYLKGSAGMSLTYYSADHVSGGLCGAVDADWGACIMTSKSTSGWGLWLCGGLVTWASRKQTCVAQSTAEAEYIAVAEALKDVLFTQQLLEELGSPAVTPTQLLEDNEACITIGSRPGTSARTRHIRRRYHFVKDHVHKGDVKLVPVASADNPADLFTKPVSRDVFQRLVKKLVQQWIAGGSDGETGGVTHM